ncbi:hypothetical protein [Carboxydothermus hydrogenoformans]|uniref:Uncharacterized protein n=1 Tax=Carboxydothermus hydrogenoformans (strain ATCC BAA-161 / DSM 6008 / Z-2901) TaxID=246194 RepID=Q3ABK7_CARHZ|nr:hypothetical protein [Carboxydothermus hydrogenoformans]ABB13642.1 hypothetical protein CHY_1657 [Carboxydothermus hydrogenoformans Z-2901]
MGLYNSLWPIVTRNKEGWSNNPYIGLDEFYPAYKANVSANSILTLSDNRFLLTTDTALYIVDNHMNIIKELINIGTITGEYWWWFFGYPALIHFDRDPRVDNPPPGEDFSNNPLMVGGDFILCPYGKFKDAGNGAGFCIIDINTEQVVNVTLTDMWGPPYHCSIVNNLLLMTFGGVDYSQYYPNSEQRILIAINKEYGTTSWKYFAGTWTQTNNIDKPITVDDAGYIYFIDGENRLCKINSTNGSLVWKATKQDGTPIYCLTQAVILDDKCYFVGYDENGKAFMAVDIATGVLIIRTQITTGDSKTYNICYDPLNHKFVTSYRDKIIVFNIFGSKIFEWVNNTRENVPQIYNTDGSVLVYSNDIDNLTVDGAGNIYFMDAGGNCGKLSSIGTLIHAFKNLVNVYAWDTPIRKRNIIISPTGDIIAPYGLGQVLIFNNETFGIKAITPAITGDQTNQEWATNTEFTLEFSEDVSSNTLLNGIYLDYVGISEVPYFWRDAPSQVTNLWVGQGDDESLGINLGDFTIKYNGTTANSINISANSNLTIYNADYSLLKYNADLYVPADGKIYYFIDNTKNPRELVITFENICYYRTRTNPDRITFQWVIPENSNIVYLNIHNLFQYGSPKLVNAPNVEIYFQVYASNLPTGFNITEKSFKFVAGENTKDFSITPVNTKTYKLKWKLPVGKFGQATMTFKNSIVSNTGRNLCFYDYMGEDKTNSFQKEFGLGPLVISSLNVEITEPTDAIKYAWQDFVFMADTQGVKMEAIFKVQVIDVNNLPIFEAQSDLNPEYFWQSKNGIKWEPFVGGKMQLPDYTYLKVRAYTGGQSQVRVILAYE